MMEISLIDSILISKRGAIKSYKEEWGWTSYKVGGKVFAITCIPAEKYDEQYANHPLLTLKGQMLDLEFLQENHADILKGFYMDKRFWISIRLDGEVTNEMIQDLCDNSYQLVFSKLTKKLQQEINGLKDIIKE